MGNIQDCPECGSEYTYEDGHMIVCPECAYEWVKGVDLEEEETVEEVRIVRDAHGAEFSEGDSATVVKDLKVRGSSDILKRGTKVSDIKFIDRNGHDIDCRVDGIGPMELKSEFLKKA